MDHQGVLLYLILHPKIIEDGTRPVGLEVNLSPIGGIVYGKRPHKNTKRVDLILYKGGKYLLIEVLGQKPQQRELEEAKKRAKEYNEIFRQSLLPQECKELLSFPIVVYPVD